ncbi:MAG: L-cystine transport system permease protein YecS [Acidimicrobiaceae bacterium]|nr:L-cystine transport system permease protein YecS [Acidimicrobiaceae bacterium]
MWARVTDLVLYTGSLLLVWYLVQVLSWLGLPAAIGSILFVLPVGFVLFNEVHLVATHGTTLGKATRQLEVVRLDGSPLNHGTAALRALLLLLFIPALVALVRSDRAFNHGILANTVVRSSEVPDLHRQRLAYSVLPVGVFFTALAVWRLGGSSTRFEAKYDVAGPDTKFDWGFFFEMIPDFSKALWVTTKGTMAGFALAVVLGLFLALGRRSASRWVRWPFAVFIEFIRSTPLLIQLFFLFFALPRIDWLPRWIAVMNPITTLMVGLGVHYATYCSEAYRAGINSVPKGQWEASTAMNLRPFTTWAQVILPQAIPNVLPALGNYLVAGFKDAPLGATVQVTGVLFFADTLSSRVFRAVEPITIVGVGFLLVSIPSAFLIRRLERRIGYERA